MASTAYQEIVQRLDSLESAELWTLLADLQVRISRRPKRSLRDFEPQGELNENREDWVPKLRAEWK